MRIKTKLNLQVVGEALLLLAVTLAILAYFSHRALRREAMLDAEQTLEGTIQNIDNILLSVEQSTGNIYYDLLNHLDDQDRMFTYSRSLVACNPNIVGCAIAFKPGYYPGKDLFMAYVHRKTSAPEGREELMTTDTFTNRPYTEQIWFAEPMKTGTIGWVGPLKGADTESEPLVTFCLPFSDANDERVGVIAVDVSVNQLSKIILAAKPSEHGYSILLAHNGAYIVHPDKEKLTNPEIFSQKERNVDQSEIEAAEVMLAGESGMKEFRRGSRDWCVFFKPFERVEWEDRADGKIDWSVGVVYPEEDIFGIHNILIYLVIGIAIMGILVFFLLCRWVILRQMKPMRQLVKSALHIADGNYTEMLPYTERQDEIGLLQKLFKKMQSSLQNQVDELKEETNRQHQNSVMLSAAYDKTIETDRMKTSVLHYLTSQMAVNTAGVDKSVTTLCNTLHDSSEQALEHEVETIHRKGQTIVELLNYIAHITGTETGKEADNGK